jgi:hypothetical protein
MSVSTRLTGCVTTARRPTRVQRVPVHWAIVAYPDPAGSAPGPAPSPRQDSTVDGRPADQGLPALPVSAQGFLHSISCDKPAFLAPSEPILEPCTRPWPCALPNDGAPYSLHLINNQQGLARRWVLNLLMLYASTLYSDVLCSVARHPPCMLEPPRASGVATARGDSGKSS